MLESVPLVPASLLLPSHNRRVACRIPVREASVDARAGARKAPLGYPTR